MVLQSLVKQQLEFINSQTTQEKKENLNCQYDFLQTHSRIRQLNTNFATSPSKKKLIASYIYLINSASTLRQEDGELTEHYARYLYLYKDQVHLYNPDFIEDSIYTLRSTWATSEGTLGYYLNLYYPDFKYHYLSPAELAYYSCISCLKALEDNASLAFSRTLKRYTALAKEPTEVNATDFYDLTTELWSSFSLSNSFQLLDFWSSFLPELVKWYLNLDQMKQLTSIEEKLKDLALICVESNLDFKAENLTNLKYEFVFSELPPIYYTVFRRLIEQRALALDNLKLDSLGDDLPAEKLYKSYLTAISLHQKPNVIKEDSLVLLQELAPPMGFNMILILVANFLVANAYNLIVKNPQSVEIDRLLYLAGYTLSKSNINALKLIGFNLYVLSDVDIEIDPKDLLNIEI